MNAKKEKWHKKRQQGKKQYCTKIDTTYNIRYSKAGSEQQRSNKLSYIIKLKQTKKTCKNQQKKQTANY